MKSIREYQLDRMRDSEVEAQGFMEAAVEFVDGYFNLEGADKPASEKYPELVSALTVATATLYAAKLKDIDEYALSAGHL